MKSLSSHSKHYSEAMQCIYHQASSFYLFSSLIFVHPSISSSLALFFSIIMDYTSCCIYVSCYSIKNFEVIKKNLQGSVIICSTGTWLGVGHFLFFLLFLHLLFFPFQILILHFFRMISLLELLINEETDAIWTLVHCGHNRHCKMLI